MSSRARASREFRNLANISETASTSRILNLAWVGQHMKADPEYRARPFFANQNLNKAILIKHTLRANEQELFPKPRTSATKIILPFDSGDLKLGGGAIFVNQAGFDRLAAEFCGHSPETRQTDLSLLKTIDALPSLDPFILKECLGRQGFRPAGCYFRISVNDIASMTAFANEEVGRLVKIAFGNTDSSASIRFANKILSDSVDTELDPLRRTLRLSQYEFSEGLFSWRGFLYFKWRYLALQEELRKVIEGVGSFQPIGFSDADLKDYVAVARPRIIRQITNAHTFVGKILLNYDTAFSALTNGHDPAPFRNFLINGPTMFFELGENVGVLSHISSFWSYRFGFGRTKRHSLIEFADLLIDFEDSLACVFLDA